ncbi:class I SAM-dependent methyltransferase [bacterium]|nr:class I SAM-dependent methyltransferase [bacterium]
MIDDCTNNPNSIKFYVKRYLQGLSTDLKDKIVIDIPAGSGATTEILLDLGARVEAFDLFPEYFMVKNMECKRADIVNTIPVTDDYADMLICQEGIEHFSDQLKVFKECNRVLKHSGKLLITTPSYSNLSSKLSYLLFESETNTKMPPNEIDDVWMSDKAITNEIFHGHIFLIGLQKLRVIAKLAGFKVKEIRYVRISRGSVALFPLLYPFILGNSLLTYCRNIFKNEGVAKRDVYREQLRININPVNLINKHTFIVFEKEKSLRDLDFRNEKVIRLFDKIL